MPPLPIIANVHRVAFNWSIGVSEHAVNVMHFEAPAMSAASLAAALEANVTANMWAWVSSSAFISSLSILELDGASGTVEIATSAGAKWAGTSAADHVPAVAQIVKLSTGFRGRSRRGRLYLPAIAENAMADGVINGSLVAQQTAWNNFLAAMDAAGAALQVASYTQTDSRDVTAVVCEAVLATQRRRQSRLRR